MEKVAELLERIEEVCPMPAAVQRVLTKVDDPRASSGEIAAAVGLDASLAAEVLRLANSPIYGRTRAVASLAEAVTTLGLNELKNMATAMAMLAAFASKHERAPELHELAVVRGAIAAALARRAGVAPAVAYLAGLLADIGALALLAVDPAAFAKILEQTGGDPVLRQQPEAAHFGATSNWIGAELLNRNGVPPEVVDAVRFAPHLTPQGVQSSLSRSDVSEAVIGTSANADSSLCTVVSLARAFAPIVRREKDIQARLPDMAALSQRSSMPIDEAAIAELLLEAGQQAKGMFRAAS